LLLDRLKNITATFEKCDFGYERGYEIEINFFHLFRSKYTVLPKGTHPRKNKHNHDDAHMQRNIPQAVSVAEKISS